MLSIVLALQQVLPENVPGVIPANPLWLWYCDKCKACLYACNRMLRKRYFSRVYINFVERRLERYFRGIATFAVH